MLKNSIVTSNGSYGVRREGEQIAVSATCNDVWDNAAGNYLNVTPRTASVSVNLCSVVG